MRLKRTIFTLICLAILLPLTGNLFSHNLFADEGTFEVDYIEDNGSFTAKGYFNDFSEAKKLMETNEDYVIRTEDSSSPSGIIAMNSGLAYSYAYRSNSEICYIYETLSDDLKSGSGATTYVNSYNEMTYYDTYSTGVYAGSGVRTGWVKVTLNGFTGYIDLENCDLVPSKFINNGIAIKLGGNGRGNYANKKSFTSICKQKYYSANVDGNYRDLDITYYIDYPGDNGVALSYTKSIGVAPSFMETGKKYYSNDGVNFYTDTKLKNLAGTYYNYYQFLPLRSYSRISGDTLNNYLKYKNVSSDSVLLGAGQDFIDDQNEYGVNGAAIFAFAIHESGWGCSDIAKAKYNLFGWGAYDNTPGSAKVYSSVKACVEAQMADNLSNYMDECSAKYYWTMSFGTKGGGFSTVYASDPYWPEKIASYYYDIDKYSKNFDGTLTDYNTETLALVTTKGANVYKSDSESSGVWYTTENKGSTHYQNNLICIVLETGSSFTKTRTSNNIDSDGLLNPIKKDAGYLAPYNSATSYGYIKNGDLQIINYGTNEVKKAAEEKAETVDENNFADIVEVNSLNISGGKLSVSGMGFFTGISFKDASQVKHELVLTNLDDNTSSTYTLNTTEMSGIDFNDGYTYKYIGFKGDIDLSGEACGTYTVTLKITDKTYSRSILLKNSASAYLNVLDSSTNRYRLTTNSRYDYRFELNIMDTPINYGEINKPSIRGSYLDITSIEVTDNSGDACLNLNGYAFIYKTAATSASDLHYDLYLVKDAQNTKVLTGQKGETAQALSEILSDSTYEYSDIAFSFNGSISELTEGTYKLILKVTNGSYIDYIDLSTISSFETRTVNVGSKEYRLYKNSNEKIILEIK